MTAVAVVLALVLVAPGNGGHREVAQAVRDAGAEVVEVEVPGANHNDAALAQGPSMIGALVEVTERAGLTGCR